MSKKSSRSKGYRSYKTEQKGFTKGELRTLIIGFVVLVLAIAAIIYLPDAIEARHLIKVENGEFVGAEDNWLIVNTGNSTKAKYRKIAEVDPAEGYALDEINNTSSANLSRTMRFKAEDEASAVAEYTVSPSTDEYKALAESVFTNFSNNGLLTMGATVTSHSDELQTCEVNGKTLYWFTAVYSYETRDDENSTDTTTHYTQGVYLYAPSDVNGMSVILSVTNEVESEDALGDVDAMLEVLKSAAAQVSSLK